MQRKVELKRMSNNGITNYKKAIVEKEASLIEENKEWLEPRGVCGIKRNLSASKLINSLTWVKTENKFYRFLNVEAHDLKYNLFDSEWYNIEVEQNSQSINSKNNIISTKFSLLEKEFSSEEDYENDIKNPSNIDYSSFCAELFNY